MIFLTVGTQLCFNRLVEAVDHWAGETGYHEIFGQIAEPGPQDYRPRHFEWVAHLEPREFQARFDGAQAVIAHAGMGTIISALSQGKPLVMMARRAHLGEQRNDHQYETARHFGSKAGIQVVEDQEETARALDALQNAQHHGAGEKAIDAFAQPQLIETLRRMILSGSID